MADSLEGLLILVLTMPGFFGYLCFNRLYEGSLDDAFEKVGLVVGLNVAALIIASALGMRLPEGLIDAQGHIAASGVIDFAVRSMIYLTLIAILLGSLLAPIVNSGGLSDLLVKLRLTRKSGDRSIFADVIRCHPDSYFRFHLKNGGYLVGHPIRYSLDGEEAAVFLERAAVGTRPSGAATGTERPVTGDGAMLLGFDDVVFVEVI